MDVGDINIVRTIVENVGIISILGIVIFYLLKAIGKLMERQEKVDMLYLEKLTELRKDNERIIKRQDFILSQIGGRRVDDGK